MGDMVPYASNRRRIYALQGFTVICKAGGWYFRRTDHADPWRGPYSSEASVCLMIARDLARELSKRDGLPN